MLTIGVLIWFIILLVIGVNVLGWWCLPFAVTGVLIAIIQKHEEKNKKPEKTAMDILKEQQAKRMEEYWNTFHMPTDPALICYYEELVKEMGEEEARKYWIEWSKPSIYKRR